MFGGAKSACGSARAVTQFFDLCGDTGAWWLCPAMPVSRTAARTTIADFADVDVVGRSYVVIAPAFRGHMPGFKCCGGSALARYSPQRLQQSVHAGVMS